MQICPLVQESAECGARHRPVQVSIVEHHARCVATKFKSHALDDRGGRGELGDVASDCR
jgi:hypothetical protein